MQQYESKYAAKKAAKRMVDICRAAEFTILPVGERFFYPQSVTSSAWDENFLTEKGHAVKVRTNV